MADADRIDALLEVVGQGALTRAAALRLIEDAGSVETAVAIYFSGSGAAASTARAGGGGAAPLQRTPATREALLREMVGPEASSAQLRTLLAQNGQSVERAVDDWLAHGLPQATAAAARGGRRGRSPDEVVLLDGACRVHLQALQCGWHSWSQHACLDACSCGLADLQNGCMALGSAPALAQPSVASALRIPRPQCHDSSPNAMVPPPIHFADDDGQEAGHPPVSTTASNRAAVRGRPPRAPSAAAGRRRAAGGDGSGAGGGARAPGSVAASHELVQSPPARLRGPPASTSDEDSGDELDESMTRMMEALVAGQRAIASIATMQRRTDNLRELQRRFRAAAGEDQEDSADFVSDLPSEFNSSGEEEADGEERARAAAAALALAGDEMWRPEMMRRAGRGGRRRSSTGREGSVMGASATQTPERGVRASLATDVRSVGPLNSDFLLRTLHAQGHLPWEKMPRAPLAHLR